MRSLKHNTTSLPRQLREELGLIDHYALTKRKQNGPISRKDQRKAERQEKKSRGKLIAKTAVLGLDAHDSLEDSQLDSEPEPEIDDVPYYTNSKSTRPAQQASKLAPKSLKPVSGDRGQEPLGFTRIVGGIKDGLAEDDAEIAALEKRLGIKFNKKLPKAFHDEGLADILGESGNDMVEEDRKRKREGDEWLQGKRRKARGLLPDGKVEIDVEDSLLDEGGDDGFGKEGDLDDGYMGEIRCDIDEFGGFSDEDYNGEHVTGDGNNFPSRKARENPYMAPVTNASSIGRKYVPPSLRLPSANQSESQIRLRRQAQGLLNKLSEANLISILAEVEELYREYPRQSVTSILVGLLLGLVCDRAALQDTFIILHAGFITAVYKIIGMDFGAEVIQKLVETFDKSYDEKETFQGKEPINLLSLLSQLYNFHVIGRNLVFDYIRLFLAEITEPNTEFLLKIIRNSGPQLRQDDPSALKDIVLQIQPAVARVGEAALSVRTKFMIETITNLKNNRLKTGITASNLNTEHITKMRKILGSLNSRNLRATEPIRVSRTDIHESPKKGKWWLVGAGWKDGSPTPACQELLNMPSAPDKGSLEDSEGEPDLLSIAKAHRMNTDVRRSIFTAIMSANDYRDARVRLLKLRLKRNQEYEIPRVLVHCVMGEEMYNPYYMLIARRLCGELGRRIKMSFMFALWDVFKRLGERGGLDEDGEDHSEFLDDEGNKLPTRSIVNLAKLYGSLVANGSLTLAILKNLNFAYMQPKTRTFVEILIITIIQLQEPPLKHLQPDSPKQNEASGTRNETALQNIFLRTQETPQVVRGLLYFIRTVVAKSDLILSSSSGEEQRHLFKWGCKVAVGTLRAISEGDSSLK